MRRQFGFGMITALLVVMAIAADYEPQVPRIANAAEGQMLVVDYRRFPPGEYLVRITVKSDRSATLEPLTMNVVDLTGNTIATPRPSPNNPEPVDPVDPEEPEEPAPETLTKVLSNYNGDVDGFMSRKLKLKVALAPPQGDDVVALHTLVKGFVSMSLGTDADKWKPWHDVWMAELNATTSDEYRAWLSHARDSLGGD